MKVKAGNSVFDTDSEPVLLVFDDNDQLIEHIKNLVDMLNYNSPGNIRKMVVFPDNMPHKNAREFMDSYPEKPKEPDVTNP